MNTVARSDPARDHPPRARTRTMVVMGGVVLALFLILLVMGIVPRARNRQTLATAAQDARTAVAGVRVIEPAVPPERGLTLAATTQAIQDSVIYARASGYLKKRYVDMGDRVKAGQLLAEIESPELDAQLRQAQANLLQAQKTLDLQAANRDLAKATMDRYLAANAENAVAVEAVDQSVSAYRTAQASVAAAEATVAANRATVKQFTDLSSFDRVVAPFDGTVIQRNVDVGALITAGSPTNNTAVAPSNLTGAPNGLFEIAQIDSLRVYVNVPQAFAPGVRAGLPVSIRIRGHLEQPVKATVTRTAGALDPGTRTLLTQVDIPNKDGRLMPGMFAYVDFSIAASGTRWRVPATAVVFDSNGTSVATVGPDNTVRFRQVELGRDFGDSIDIQAGLRGDEAIILQPTVALAEGQVVRPIRAQGPR